MRADVRYDWDWALPYTREAHRIVLDYTRRDIREATLVEDTRQATDFVIPENRISGAVALRLRRDKIWQRDLTLRYRRRRGGRWSASNVEVEKILAGWADFYFYAWTAADHIGDWILVTLDALRASGLIEDACETREKINDDRRTSFVWIRVSELDAVDALLASDVLATPSRGDVMREQIPDAVARLEARGALVDLRSLGLELGGIANGATDRDLPGLFAEYVARRAA